MQSYYNYPAESSRTVSRQCSSAPADPNGKDGYPYWEPSQQASASYTSLYNAYGYPISSIPPSLNTSYATEADLASPISIYSDDSPYETSNSYPGQEYDMDVDGSHSVYAHPHCYSTDAPPPPPPNSWAAPDSQCQWEYPKPYDSSSQQYDYDPETGICVYEHDFADGVYEIVRSSGTQSEGPDDHAPFVASGYYQPQHYYADESSGSSASPLAPVALSDAAPSWQTPSTFSSQHSYTLLPSSPDSIPLHQPRPTRRFDYQKMNDIAASLEAAMSSDR